MTIPQLSSSLTLNGRDSKFHVTDYCVGNIDMLYSTAEIYTWKQYAGRTVLLLYGGINETHEASFLGQNSYNLLEGTGVTVTTDGNTLILNWAVTPQRKIIRVGTSLYVYLLGIGATGSLCCNMLIQLFQNVMTPLIIGFLTCLDHLATTQLQMPRP